MHSTGDILSAKILITTLHNRSLESIQVSHLSLRLGTNTDITVPQRISPKWPEMVEIIQSFVQGEFQLPVHPVISHL